MNKNANFGPNLVVLGQKVLISTGEIKRFVTQKTENPPRHLVRIVFWSGMGRNGGKNANIWPKMTKNAYFGPNLAVFWPKVLIFMGVSKSFGTNITENHLDNLSALFFGQALDQMGQKCQYLAKNASLRPNLAVFGPQINCLGAGSKNFGTVISGF